MSGLMKTYENVKMNLVGAINLSFDSLDKEIQMILLENQAKDQRIKELEARIKELEK
jgi:hypothetical protein